MSIRNKIPVHLTKLPNYNGFSIHLASTTLQSVCQASKYLDLESEEGGGVRGAAATKIKSCSGFKSFKMNLYQL